MRLSKSLRLCIFVAVSIALTSSYLSGLVSYDEVWAYDAIKSYSSFILDVFAGAKPAYQSIYSNAEYYGIIDRILPFVLFSIQRLWLFGHGTLEHIVSSNLSDWIVTGYTDIQHAFNLCMFLLGGYFVYLISSTIYPASRNLATFSYFTFPVLVGHAVFNYKDIFIATVYTGFTLNLIVARLSCHRNPCLHRLLSALITALMCSQKLVFFLPLALTHTIWELSCINYENLQPRKDFSAAVTRSIAYVLITVLFWYVLTPAAWLSPVSFIDQSLRLFTDFDQGGGCTYLLGHEFCLRENPSLAIKYILGWIFAHSPLHILLGYLACLAVTVGTLLGKKILSKIKSFVIS